MSAAVGHAGPLHSFVVSFDANGACTFLSCLPILLVTSFAFTVPSRRLPTPHSLNNSM
jgi:hypothetical protein